MDKKKSDKKPGKKRKTRNATKCQILEVSPNDMPQCQLPAIVDVWRFFMFVQLNEPNLKVEEIASKVADKVESVYDKASIFGKLSNITVRRQVKKIHSKVESLKKHLNRDSTQSSKLEFQKEASNLFDIATCKCWENKRTKCSCKGENRLEDREFKFLHNQRTERTSWIGPEDKIATEKAIKKEEAKIRFYANCEKLREEAEAYQRSLYQTNSSNDSDDDDGETVDQNDPNYEPEAKKSKPSTYCTIDLTKFAVECVRTRTSHQSAALLANALLCCFGLITPDNTTLVIDGQKVRRAMEKVKSHLSEKLLTDENPLEVISFDSRKDQTRAYDENNRPTTIKENHMVLVKIVKDLCSYFGHLTIPAKILNSPKEAERVLNELKSFFTERGIEYKKSLKAVLCDGTAVNTGKHAGIIRRLEEHLKEPLQWFICLLHFNELPLRHLINELFNEKSTTENSKKQKLTVSPTGFSGEFGKLIEKAQDSAIVRDFPTIKTNLQPLDDKIVKDLSRDQQTLYRLAIVVSTGDIDSYADPKLGPLSHARWVTLAARILRLYITYPTPPEKIEIAAKYIMTVYVPSWFDIKRESECTKGSIHFFKMMQRVKSLNLTKDLKEKVEKIFEINSYFAHPENVLLSMLVDPDIDIV